MGKEVMKDAHYWLPKDKYEKAVGQFRMQVVGVFDFLKVDEKLPVRYVQGMGAFVPGAIVEIVRLAEDFGLRVRGVDKPLALGAVRRSLNQRLVDKKEGK